MVSINSERLMNDLRRVAEFGSYKTGVHRPTFSPQDIEARNWLSQSMRDANLDASIDGVGNVVGKCETKGPVLLVGSHAESECYAGWLDGILGVVYAIELARAFHESSDCSGFGIDVGVWADEECHFLQFLGSRSFVGDLDEREIDAAFSKNDGTSLRDALRIAGYAGRAREKIDPTRYVGYLEAHIEQGDYLDGAGLRLGVVTSIVGLFQYKVSFFGEQNHAGTTRMVSRKDAGLSLVRLVNEIDRTFPTIAGARSVWTTGQILLDPGAPCIIPGHAEMQFQFRDDSVHQLELFEMALQRLVAEANGNPCRCELETAYRTMPKPMNPMFQEILEGAAETHAPNAHVRMASMATHDAQIIANHIPASMLFVPSIGGVSHHYTENTREEDIILGCQVLATAAERILKKRHNS